VAGSSSAFALAELARLNRKRLSRKPFQPYASLLDAGAPSDAALDGERVMADLGAALP
jgi:hypothetical protein